MKVYDCDNPDHFKVLEQLEEEKELVKTINYNLLLRIL